jgi:FtsP/CotA-like multicopper oxidase with cupredoxin domain
MLSPPVMRTVAMLALALAGCTQQTTSANTSPSPSASASASAPPLDPPADDLHLPIAKSLNSDPAILEVNLEARIAPVQVGAQTVDMWTYGGTVPGPLLRAHQGDTLIVHVSNQLPEDTSIHWHGVRVPNAMDGTPEVQAPIKPGGHFDYQFKLPDAGTFWFHSHDQAAKQVGYGLYGPIVVTDPNEPEDLGEELVLVLSDVGLVGDQLAPPDSDGKAGSVSGREGEIILVNGLVKPTINLRRGVRQRWRFINASKSRYYLLHIPGHSMVLVGGDGGLRSEPVNEDEHLLTPGERAEVLLVPTGKAGDDVPVQDLPYIRGNLPTSDPQDLFYFHLTHEPEVVPPSVPEHLRAIEPLSQANAIPVDIQISATAYGGFQVSPMDSIKAHVGDTQIWNVYNHTEFDHPFHLHGFFFQVLSTEGAALPQNALEWKDTVNIKARDDLSFIVRYDDRPGMWMYHCHILDHAEIGLLGMLEVEEP